MLKIVYILTQQNYALIKKLRKERIVRISKCKNICAKWYTPNWSEEVFAAKNTVPWTYVVNDFNGNEIIETFFEKELQKTNQQEFRTEKIIKKKGDKLCKMDRLW